jgi:hypothetical protein
VWCATGGNKSRGGQTADLKGVDVAVTAYINGEPRTQLELLEGFQKIPFGAGEASLFALPVALNTSEAPPY